MWLVPWDHGQVHMRPHMRPQSKFLIFLSDSVASFSQTHWIRPVSALSCRHSASETRRFRSLYSPWSSILTPPRWGGGYSNQGLWTGATSRSHQQGSCIKLTEAPGEKGSCLEKASPGSTVQQPRDAHAARSSNCYSRRWKEPFFLSLTKGSVH